MLNVAYLLQELERKVDFWMEKYDKDVEAKQHELDVLKASKAKDLERLQELTKLVSVSWITVSANGRYIYIFFFF